MAWTTSYYHYDAVGSTCVLTDNSQNVTDSYVYDAFGNEHAITGGTVNPFRYIGEMGYYYDIDSRNYFVRQRFYSPAFIRWLSVDPIGFDAGDDHLYRYVSNNPINVIDPTGLVNIDCWCRLMCYQYGIFEYSCPKKFVLNCDQRDCKKLCTNFCDSIPRATYITWHTTGAAPDAPPATPWEVYCNCSKSECESKCSDVLAACTGYCTVGCAYTGPLFPDCITKCGAICGAGWAACYAGCKRCTKP